MAYPDAFDVTLPLGSEARANGDDRIREMKRALSQRLSTIIDGWPDTDPFPSISVPQVITDLLTAIDGAISGNLSVAGTITGVATRAKRAFDNAGIILAIAPAGSSAPFVLPANTSWTIHVSNSQNQFMVMHCYYFGGIVGKIVQQSSDPAQLSASLFNGQPMLNNNNGVAVDFAYTMFRVM